MRLRDKLLMATRTAVLDLAHHPRLISTRWHARLEAFADRVIGPWMFLF